MLAVLQGTEPGGSFEILKGQELNPLKGDDYILTGKIDLVMKGNEGLEIILILKREQGQKIVPTLSYFISGSYICTLMA